MAVIGALTSTVVGHCCSDLCWPLQARVWVAETTNISTNISAFVAQVGKTYADLMASLTTHMMALLRDLMARLSRYIDRLRNRPSGKQHHWATVHPWVLYNRLLHIAAQAPDARFR